jgi:hypothetical protein
LTAPAVAGGTASVKSASGAERAAGAQLEARRMMRPGVKVKCHRERCRPSATSAGPAVANGTARSQAHARGTPRKELVRRHKGARMRAN